MMPLPLKPASFGLIVVCLMPKKILLHPSIVNAQWSSHSVFPSPCLSSVIFHRPLLWFQNTLHGHVRSSFRAQRKVVVIRACPCCAGSRCHFTSSSLLGLACSRVSLAPEFAAGGRTVAEEAREERLEEGAEDDLGAAVVKTCQYANVDGGYWVLRSLPSLGKSHPEDQDELEGVVEGEPVDGVDRRLDHSEEGVSHPVLFPTHQHTIPSNPHRSFDKRCSSQVLTVNHCVSSLDLLVNRASSE